MAAVAGSAVEQRAGPLRVVLADDAEDMRMLLRTRLSMCSSVDVVAEARDGREAIEAVKATAADALILDMDMPHIDGMGVIDALRDDADVRIVVYTAAINVDVRAEALARGAHAYFDKGADLDDVVAALESCAPPPAVSGAIARRTYTRIYSAGVALLGAAAIGWASIGLRGTDVVAAALVAVAYGIAFRFAVHLLHGSDRQGSMHIDAHVNVAALVLAPPPALILGGACGLFVALASRRLPARRVTRGFFRHAVVLASGAMVADAVRKTGLSATPAAVVGSAAMVAVNFAVFALGTLADGEVFAVRRTLRLCAAIWAGAAPVGALVALAALQEPMALVLMAVPWGLLLLASGHFLRSRSERALLAGLLDAATRAQSASSGGEVETILVETAAGLLDGAVVRLASTSAAPSGCTAVEVHSHHGRRWLVADTNGDRESALAVLEPVAAVGAALLSGARRVESSAASAVVDPLTGLPNRTALDRALDRVVAQGERVGSTAAVLFVDLDGFKNINDSLGHDAGDRVLTIVADRLRAAVRPYDVVARVGGDEFVVVLGATSDRGAIGATVTRIRGLAAVPIDVAGRTVCVGASVGVASYPAHGRTPDELLRHADLAMYRDKATRRGAGAG